MTGMMISSTYISNGNLNSWCFLCRLRKKIIGNILVEQDKNKGHSSHQKSMEDEVHKWRSTYGKVTENDIRWICVGEIEERGFVGWQHVGKERKRAMRIMANQETQYYYYNNLTLSWPRRGRKKLEGRRSWCSSRSGSPPWNAFFKVVSSDTDEGRGGNRIERFKPTKQPCLKRQMSLLL